MKQTYKNKVKMSAIEEANKLLEAMNQEQLEKTNNNSQIPVNGNNNLSAPKTLNQENLESSDPKSSHTTNAAKKYQFW